MSVEFPRLASMLKALFRRHLHTSLLRKHQGPANHIHRERTRSNTYLFLKWKPECTDSGRRPTPGEAHAVRHNDHVHPTHPYSTCSSHEFHLSHTTKKDNDSVSEIFFYSNCMYRAKTSFPRQRTLFKMHPSQKCLYMHCLVALQWSLRRRERRPPMTA